MPIIFKDPNQNPKIKELLQKEQERLTRMLSGRFNIPYVNLADVPINTSALRLIKENDSRNNELVAFNLENKTLSIAVKNPKNPGAKEIINSLEKQNYIIRLFLTSENSLKKAWSRYEDISFASRTKEGALDISSEEIEKFINEIQSTEMARSLINEIMGLKRSARISRIVETIIASAMATKASDIHIEPEENNINVRFRIDGVLIKINEFDEDTYKLLLSRIKLLSGLMLNIKNNAQDGRFSVRVGKKEIEIRTSILPGNYGESVVMRLLDPTNLVVSIKDLGVPEYLIDIFKEEVDKPHGMIINTGPTGSGKTTTLYSFLSRKRGPGIKIITIEDPIEYHLSGIVQTQVDKKKGYDFAKGLKSSLRQDPDAIMVGEIRDHETAETAVQAALTGHMVFSTLHTNTAAGAFPRLIDLGLNPRILITAITLVIAQRLARKVCSECRKEVPIETDKIEILKSIYESMPEERKTIPFKETQFIGEGCEACNFTGYKGRIGIFEAVVNNREVEEAISNDSSEREIRQIAQKSGLLDMAQDGMLKILEGKTDFNEVDRVVDMEKREGKMYIKEIKID